MREKHPDVRHCSETAFGNMTPKSEPKDESLATLLGILRESGHEKVKILQQLGFVEQVGQPYEVTMLYRDSFDRRPAAFLNA